MSRIIPLDELTTKLEAKDIIKYLDALELDTYHRLGLNNNNMTSAVKKFQHCTSDEEAHDLVDHYEMQNAELNGQMEAIMMIRREICKMITIGGNQDEFDF